MATDADADEALIRRIEDRSDRIGLEILKEKSKNNNFKSIMFKTFKSFSKTIS